MGSEVLIETQQLTKSFGGLVAVDDVNYQLFEGEKCGIVGPNGAGKTTLINLISGYLKPTKGRVLYCGKDITKLKPFKRVELGIVRTFQLASLFLNMSALENVAIAVARFSKNYESKGKRFLSPLLDSDIQEKAYKLLEMTKLDCVADCPIASLPYGNRRKIEVLMALAQNPKVILFDEPFAGLSEPEINEITRLIEKLCKDRTMIMVEHKITKLQEIVDRLSVMYEGKLIADGRPKDVINDPKVQELYWRYKE
ncbi:MAG: ABC transporter ATP-binding protein [Nitrososphaerota archaeon]|nr:ABC transporter ATP-binding protein [Candidatus Bathyarchaeota archaeon]MDW8024209.1 ABC transporter ATP-binding protein [Nitrososphaerota archaeon]